MKSLFLALQIQKFLYWSWYCQASTYIYIMHLVSHVDRHYDQMASWGNGPVSPNPNSFQMGSSSASRNSTV